ncbi:MAG: FlgD immunoglobulin-like domain containing protein [Solirubrobacteraceae bacterium]
MRRLPVAAFVALVLATVAAFFVTQHLKVTTPLVAGDPAPVPSHINPVDGKTCVVYTRLGTSRVSFKRMRISFYLLHRTDDVDVYIVDQNGVIVDTLASGRHLRKKVRSSFTWDGREDNGSVAPDGTYYIRVSLIHQGRSLLIANSAGAEPVVVETKPPPLVLTGVTPQTISKAGAGAVTISYTGNKGLRPRVLIYRVEASGSVRLVKSYEATSRAGHSSWNGTLQGGAPAPAGRYVVGLKLTDRACNTATSPARLPPSPTSDPSAAVTVG